MKSIKKYMVIALCAVIVACSVVGPMRVNAETSALNTNGRVVDIALTKTGIVAKQEIVDIVAEKIQNTMTEAMLAFNEWCYTQNVDTVTVEEFYNFVRSSTADSVGQEVAKLLNANIISPEFVVTWVNHYRSDIQDNIDIYKANTNKDINKYQNVGLSDEYVKYIRTVFDDYADSDAPYVYVNTLSPANVNPLWFKERSQYLYFKDYAENLTCPVYVTMLQHTGKQYFSTGNDNTYKAETITLCELRDAFGLYRHHEGLGSDNYKINIGIVDEEWDIYGSYNFSQPVSNMDKLTDVEYWFGPNQLSTIFCNFEMETEGYGRAWLITNDGRAVKVFKTLDDYKNFTVGREPYYVTVTSGSYNTTDNSTTVSGDYITGSNYQYSHEVVQNEIDNTQNVDNSVVNNIVNNNTSTIINNYASSVLPGNGGNDSGSGGGLGSILDGLGSIISAVADIVGFLLGVIGDVIGLIGQLFTVVFEGLKTIGTLVGDFPKLLGDLFVFIPQELISFLVLAIEASVGIAIWRKFSKK